MAKWRHIKQGKIKKPPPSPTLIYPLISDRLKAFLIDTFMITMPIMYIVIYLVMGSREEFRNNMALGWLFIIIPHFFIVTTLWSFKAQTPGMKAYNIKVVQWSDPTKRINFFQATLRYLLMPLSIFSILGVVMALFRKDRATLYDLASFSRVVVADI